MEGLAAEREHNSPDRVGQNERERGREGEDYLDHDQETTTQRSMTRSKKKENREGEEKRSLSS